MLSALSRIVSGSRVSQRNVGNSVVSFRELNTVLALLQVQLKPFYQRVKHVLMDVLNCINPFFSSLR
nr:Uncharacterised protein [Providencia rettgeri]